jgi:hypothetical protein
MLALPLLLGIALTRGRSAAAWMVVPGFLLAFLAHDALVQAVHAARRENPASGAYVGRRATWGAVYLAGAASCFLAVLILAPPQARPATLCVAAPVAAAAVVFALASALRRGHELWSELIGMAGVALGAPLMAAAAGTPPLGLPLGAAAMAYAYCLSSVTLVRTYERPRAAPAVCVAVHLLLFGGMILLAWVGTVPRWGPLAFLPVAVRTAAALARPPRNLRELGMRELWVAASFALLSVWSIVVSG